MAHVCEIVRKEKEGMYLLNIDFSVETSGYRSWEWLMRGEGKRGEVV